MDRAQLLVKRNYANLRCKEIFLTLITDSEAERRLVGAEDACVG